MDMREANKCLRICVSKCRKLRSGKSVDLRILTLTVCLTRRLCNEIACLRSTRKRKSLARWGERAPCFSVDRFETILLALKRFDVVALKSTEGPASDGLKYSSLVTAAAYRVKKVRKSFGILMQYDQQY
ncbi:hypothetical protein M513_04268 [Trichuris suis]|uniref:Uncharacterized protein n=1 Tax=Trichuris suis TaxID=68888 RepID=A0A085MC88_9BILA|nr:hypothetical protein M513_04268 [Trichuris suis]